MDFHLNYQQNPKFSLRFNLIQNKLNKNWFWISSDSENFKMTEDSIISEIFLIQYWKQKNLWKCSESKLIKITEG